MSIAANKVGSDQYAIPEKMRGAVLFGPRDIRVVERPVEKPGYGEVLVKVAMCGTCGTDLKIFEGHFPLTPPFGDFIPGHEWTGMVVALGEGVDEFAPGDRVCIEAHHGCGRCDNCLRSREAALAASTEATRLGASLTRLLDEDGIEIQKPKREIKARVVRIDQPAPEVAPTPAVANMQDTVSHRDLRTFIVCSSFKSCPPGADRNPAR